MIYALYHAVSESLGLIEGALRSASLSFRESHLYRGDVVPAAQDVSGLIVMGGPMNVGQTEAYPYLKQEVDLIRDLLCDSKPVLGVCLGAQLMAKALGETVYANSKKEVGWHPIDLTLEAANDPLFSALPSRFNVLHWHGDTFKLPIGAVPLAKTDVCASQAFRWRTNSYGLQFHLEVTPPMAESWCDDATEQSFISAAGEKSDDIKRQTPASYDVLEPLARRFFTDYLNLAYPSEVLR